MMSNLKKCLQWFGLLLAPVGLVFASSSNPIPWEQTQSFPAEVFISGGTYVAEYRFVNAIPFKMPTPLVIEKKTQTPAEFSYDDYCTGKKLDYLESCTVTIYLNPTTAGTKSIQLTEVYGNDRVPLPQISTVATNTNGGTEITGTPTLQLPVDLAINASAPWLFRYTNDGTSGATGVNVVVSGGSYSTDCGLDLSSTPPSNTCYVRGTYTATSAGPHTIAATLSYTQGSPVELSTSTNGGDGTSGLVCKPAVAFAPETKIDSIVPITLLCTNKTALPITITGRTTTLPLPASQGSFAIGAGGDNCTAQTLASTGSCQLKGSYTAPNNPIANVTIGLSVNYNTPSHSGLNSVTSTSTDIVTLIINQRNITVINQCNFDVWWSMVGGAITDSPACNGTGINGGCLIGSTCNVSAKLCYYNNYGPLTGGYKLANGGQATTQVIETAASTTSDHILWKGLIAAANQCTEGDTCLNNDCQSNGGTTSCTAGVGFKQPSTEAEFTFLLTGPSRVDSYDISNVNGFSIPMSMATSVSASGYSCGTAGSIVASGGLNACNYQQMSPPTNMYYWVTNTNTACNSGNTCSDNSQICGLSFSTTANKFVRNCGDFLGFWAADQICGVDSSYTSTFGDNFSCNQVLSSPFPANTYTLTQLLKCSPPVSTAPLFNSCYLSYTGNPSSTELTQCCGCSDWVGIATPSASCPSGQSDPQWTKYVYGLIKWMKEACPTSYTYPYDDKASSFTCEASETTDYTITFCPGGQSGLPANKTDGR